MSDAQSAVSKNKAPETCNECGFVSWDKRHNGLVKHARASHPEIIPANSSTKAITQQFLLEPDQQPKNSSWCTQWTTHQTDRNFKCPYVRKHGRSGMRGASDRASMAPSQPQVPIIQPEFVLPSSPPVRRSYGSPRSEIPRASQNFFDVPAQTQDQDQVIFAHPQMKDQESVDSPSIQADITGSPLFKHFLAQCLDGSVPGEVFTYGLDRFQSPGTLALSTTIQGLTPKELGLINSVARSFQNISRPGELTGLLCLLLAGKESTRQSFLTVVRHKDNVDYWQQTEVKLANILQQYFNSAAVAQWFISHLVDVTPKTFQLCKDLLLFTIPNKSDHGYIKLLLDLHGHVEYDELDPYSFCRHTSFLMHKQCQIWYDELRAAAPLSIISLSDFIELAEFLTDANNQSQFRTHSPLAQVPLGQWIETLQHQQENQEFQNDATLAECLKEVQKNMPSVSNLPTSFRQICEQGPENLMFRSFNDYGQLKPSNMQMAIALAAGCKVVYQKSRPFILQIGAGKGKSRVIAALTLYFLHYGTKNKYHVDILCPDERLMTRDLEHYKEWLETDQNLLSRVHFHSEIVDDTLRGEFLIVDEIDHVMELHGKRFSDLISSRKQRGVVGLTGTVVNTSDNSSEALYYKAFKFDTHKTPLAGQHSDLQIEPLSSNLLLDKVRSCQGPCIVYCADAYRTVLEQHLPGDRLRFNIADHHILAKLHELDKNVVLVVTDSSLMRGFDYRHRGPPGITLFMHRKVPSDRDWFQALSRVGRNGDPCKRYHTFGTNSYIDFSLKAALAQKVNNQLQHIKGNKPVKTKNTPLRVDLTTASQSRQTSLSAYTATSKDQADIPDKQQVIMVEDGDTESKEKKGITDSRYCSVVKH